ncbi:outer membrane protein OmpA-like peptidoglycan-associated protein [Flavobacterium sp. 103]|uniref:OmpA family protein n=1 Tax=Flavobacterium sp. 103 TaxID=2135624 RepID=UPI000D5DFACE|nr:OmpA family protein [Flavobacterium sp. 103]PVX45398.1 outer membrane protein OmpA-like peptidoglycan-associated protein [Flavobacterium sp. 103]
MKIKKLLYSLFLSIFFLHGFAQKSTVTKAEKNYDRFAYVDAIDNYEKVAAKGYQDEKMFQKLGNSYYFKAEFSQALKWYDQLFALYPNQEPEYFYRYSQTLKSNGDYSKADQMLEQFNQKTSNDKRGKLFKDNRNYLDEIKANSGRFQVVDAGVNSVFSDYGSSILGNKLVFASARDTGGVSKKVFKWTNKSFTNLYWSEIKPDGEMGTPERFERKINSKFNESTPIFTQDGQTMYFTRNNFLEGKRGRDANKNTLLKLYKATLDQEGQWSNVTELPFNSNEYSVAHPTLSVDEKTLYFASDMPGTFGQSDLFRVKINGDGTYGVPENLGSEVNTEGRETFPFISNDNELYFASDGRPGLGGLDVFVARIGTDNSFYDIQNVGEPINSTQDDFAFLINSKNRNGFFTSNREGGQGYDDIYRFVENKKLACEQTLSGLVTDLDSGQILISAQMSLFDANFKPLQVVQTDGQGRYSFPVDCSKTYYVRGEKEEYQTNEVPVTTKTFSGSKDLPVVLERRIKPVGVGTDLAKTLNIPIVYFDLDKSSIRKDAAYELSKVLAVMQQYPQMKIEVRSHTDSRQTAKYNDKLSDKRAKATVDWLVNNGINSVRLIGNGYGESQLVNHCSDGVKCTEEEHQANRRSEFIIVSMHE